jgi:hypothetical protein
MTGARGRSERSREQRRRYNRGYYLRNRARLCVRALLRKAVSPAKARAIASKYAKSPKGKSARRARYLANPGPCLRRTRKATERASDGYILRLLHLATGVSIQILRQVTGMADAKRAQLQVLRHTKGKNNAT